MVPYVKSLHARLVAIARRHHAIKMKFIRVILCRAPAGSQVSRQFTERNSYSLQVHIIVAVIFLEQRKGNDQSKVRHRYASDTIRVKNNWIAA